MSAPHYAKAQRGMSLLEALLALLLMALIGMGLAMVLGRTLLTQRQQGSQQLAISQMRQQLASGSCQGATQSRTLALGAQSLAASCGSRNVQLRVVPGGGGLASQTVTVSIPQMQADSPLLGGRLDVRSAS